ncbi:hypothetical protein B9Z65_9169 [Elsinoe australis]|uniref:Sphingoid long-chain base transporter RSB1 n=1 Tax=Elsinoe australis TaxID=40998 RepID=A0A2P7Z0R1_9PEZI|nr:hypothetical protein B9Z65_9169 [Elsinoe australis]
MSNVRMIPALNGTLIDFQACTVDICSLDYAQLDYVPSKSVNLAYLLIFGLLLLVHCVQGVYYRTWGYAVGMVGGLTLEVVGYAGRLGLHNDIFSFDTFVMYLVCLTIAPAFLSASIYLCLSRIVVVCGEDVARFRPRTYTITFVCCDLISLILQSAGGAIASIADDKKTGDIGVDVMIAGLAFQVISLLLYMVVALDFFLRFRKASFTQLNANFSHVRNHRLFTYMAFGLATATLFIFIRCVYRVAELSGGFNSELANDEIAFNILEGPMIMIACLALTALHPGLCFRGAWRDANWTWRAQKGTGSGEADVAYEKGSVVRSSVELMGR